MRLIDADELKIYISDIVKAQKGRDLDLIPVGELPLVIDKQPSISEQEIRDKVVEEFADMLTAKIQAQLIKEDISTSSRCVGVDIVGWIRAIAEQMKEV